jgi:hypothetical protein
MIFDSPKRNPLILLTAALLLASGSLYSQIKDFRSWNEISFEKELTDDMDLQSEIGLRFDNNATRLDENLYEVELQYKGLKDYDISTSYRLSMGNEVNYTEYLHRWCFEGELEKDLDPFEVEFRTRFQTEYIPSAEYEDRFEHYLRDKLTLNYKINDFPVDPYIAFEHFLPLNNRAFVITDKNRYIVGTDIELDKGFELDISYRFQRSFDDIRQYDYILKLGIGYEL